MAENKRKRSGSTGSCSESTSSQPVSTAPSRLSLKSDTSKMNPPNFKKDAQSGAVYEHSMKDLVQLTRGHWTRRQCLSSDREMSSCQQCGQKCRRTQDDTGNIETCSFTCHYTLKVKNRFKEEMQRKFTLASEGDSDEQSLLLDIYTDVYITAGESAEHESGRVEHKLKSSCEDSINLRDIFKPVPGQDEPSRTVLTKGVAGIGKSFAVQKFILDWAEEQGNQDVGFVFCLAFRELNLSIGEKSFHELLTEFHPELCDLKHSQVYVQTEVIVILDGLDESRLQLDFNSHKAVTSVSTAAALGDLIANLIQGNLLPNAKLWITSRPAASSQIPAKYVDTVTEIRGFSDSQKEEYFKRRFSHDPSLAQSIISHVQCSLGLNIMCQIPIFCWISAVLFEEDFGGDEKDRIPQTLTEMMAHFLFAQTKRRSRKYDSETEENQEELLEKRREFLLKLGKLAFVHLQKNNLIFYEEDLKDCCVDVNEASIYSGFCNSVLREEKLFSHKKVFFFVHLTIQEFFAALYVYDCLINNNPTELSNFLDLKDKEHDLPALLKMIVDKAMGKKNGHLDLFMQFLLGLMVEPNRRVLRGLLRSDPNQDTGKKILTYIKSIRRKTISPESCMSLFQTMVEMRDHKVKDEIQDYLTLTDRSQTDLSPLHCSALAYMLQVSKDHLDVLDLKSYSTSEEGRRRLIPAVKISRKAILANCSVTAEWIRHLVFAFKFPNSCLRDLDLSNTDLKDSGVELLCDGLSNQLCRLETLRLSGCLVTEKGCEHLASALKSNPSHLRELDLSYDHPGASGKKLLSELTNDPQYKLCKLNIDYCGSHRMKPGFKKYACELTFDPNTANQKLVLSEGNKKVTWVQEQQAYPRHPERFDQVQQVLGHQGLAGRCYFELEVLEPFNIGLMYRTAGRKGDGRDCKLGHNHSSWSLTCSDDGCYVLHGDERVSVVSQCSRSSRVGVYLDRPAGTLSFYRVSSDSRIHIHTFKATFSEPLHPAVELHAPSCVRFCD